MAEENVSYSAKRPLWQWVLVYVVIGLVVYGMVYYFVLAKKEGKNPNSPAQSTPPATTEESSSSAEAATPQEVILLTARGFSPASLTIKAGTKVIWVNQAGALATVDSNPHPAHTDYQPLNLGNFKDKERLFLTFDKPGTYKYHNHLNSGQTGTIIVQ